MLQWPFFACLILVAIHTFPGGVKFLSWMLFLDIRHLMLVKLKIQLSELLHDCNMLIVQLYFQLLRWHLFPSIDAFFFNIAVGVFNCYQLVIHKR
jgi:hypothetical protein